MITKVKKSAKHIISAAGTALLGLVCKKAKLDRLNELPSEQNHPSNQYLLSDIVKTQMASMCCGDPSYEGVRELRDSAKHYSETLDTKGIISPERCRQRLDLAGETEQDKQAFHEAVVKCNLDMLKGQPLTTVLGFFPADMDSTPFDESKSNKENISMTYKKVMGYAPNYIYCGREGYMISTEGRPGSQHCQKGTPEMMKAAMKAIRVIYPEGDVLFRLDSGYDSMENYHVVMQGFMHFICKHNLRKETPLQWYEHALKYTLPENISHPREGKTVYIGSDWQKKVYKDSTGKVFTYTLRIVYEVIERTMEPNGQLLMPPTIEVNTFCTNTGLTDEQVIYMYHQHATCEQYHSELKNDLDFEKVPSGKYSTNAVLNDVAMLAYNALRCIGMETSELKKVPQRGDAFRRRLKTVIHNLICIPAQVIHHSDMTTLDLGCDSPWADAFIHVFSHYKQCTSMT